MTRHVLRLPLLSCTLLLAACGQTHQDYPLLSERIFVDDPNDTFINFTDLRASLRAYVAQAPDQIGLYFEYLPSGVPVGINDEQRFVAASLLKVPIAMAVYQLNEQGKLDLSRKETLTQDMLDDRFGSLWKKGAGYTLTIHDAIREMLSQSDNTAKRLLVDVLQRTDPAALDAIFDELDMPKEFDGGEMVISPLSYSSMMRSLYLSGSLTKEHSAEILDLLTRTPFIDKLQAGLPDGVRFAHKIGVYGMGSEEQVFSDCGIVYTPKRPYLLCVMVRTHDDAAARRYMRDISIRTYDAVVNGPMEQR